MIDARSVKERFRFARQIAKSMKYNADSQLHSTRMLTRRRFFNSSINMTLHRYECLSRVFVTH